MNAIALLLLNFSETRRRSITLWNGIPEPYLQWKPDAAALSILEMIRHVLEGEHLFHTIVLNRGDLGAYPSPWQHQPYGNVKEELQFAARYRTIFLDYVQTLKESDLSTIRIERKEVGQSKLLGDYLNRMVYHESVHTGQLLGYLRTLGIERPNVWD